MIIICLPDQNSINFGDEDLSLLYGFRLYILEMGIVILYMPFKSDWVHIGGEELLLYAILIML